jgi:hypothetical protein
MDADCDESGMAVNADTVGLEDLDLNTLVSFRSDDDFGSGIGDVYGHNKLTGIETGAPFDLGLEDDAAIAECGVNWTKCP